ncbi:hypothetical protein DICVIV_08486 [Dictyocaulus viviparus]|uniref:Uncharacterized protein n=1 Tax=Dictyocaulus viviparus TaxID=29172 RepID=A0A0D8XLH4_DICVI|nr:hypothetical protein DICVIV_08486 [Dictyocaulus viviparus]
MRGTRRSRSNKTALQPVTALRTLLNSSAEVVLHNPLANAFQLTLRPNINDSQSSHFETPLFNTVVLVISGVNMMMADSQPARFSIEELLRSRHSILANVLPKDESKKSDEQHHLPSTATVAPVSASSISNVDQLPFWLSCAAASFPFEQSILMAQRTVIPQLWAAAASSDALRIAATSKSYRRRKARTVFSDQQLQGSRSV